MCLSTLWDKKTQKQWLTKHKGPLYGYKVVEGKDNGYYPLVFNWTRQHPVGIAELPKRKRYVMCDFTIDKYVPYWHFYATRKGATHFGLPSQIVIKCRIYKNSVTAIGRQDGKVVIVARKAKFPKYPNRK